MKMRAVGVVVVTLVSLGSASGVQSSPSTSAEFVGTMPCGDAIRAFVDGLAADAPCHAVTLRFDFAATDSTGPVWMMDAVYGVPPRSNPNLMITGPRVITRGHVEHSGNTYRLTARSGKAISFRQISSTLAHPVDDQGRLMVGSAGWSYTLNRADSTDDKGRPETTMNSSSRSLMPRATGNGVLGVFEGRTPCVAVARTLRIPLNDGCQKVKWRVTLLQDTVTREPTRYRVEGTLHRSAGGREGTWRVVRGTAQDPNATVLQLDGSATEPPMLLWKVDENLLLFLDGRKEPLTGTIDFSYTLNRSR